MSVSLSHLTFSSDKDFAEKSRFVRIFRFLSFNESPLAVAKRANAIDISIFSSLRRFTKFSGQKFI